LPNFTAVAQFRFGEGFRALFTGFCGLPLTVRSIERIAASGEVNTVPRSNIFEIETFLAIFAECAGNLSGYTPTEVGFACAGIECWTGVCVSVDAVVDLLLALGRYGLAHHLTNAFSGLFIYSFMSL
jgi:hypothetical protein